MHQSIPSANIPRANPGDFFWGSQKPAPGKISLQKHDPRGKIHLSPGSILEDLVSLSC